MNMEIYVELFLLRWHRASHEGEIHKYMYGDDGFIVMYPANLSKSF